MRARPDVVLLPDPGSPGQTAVVTVTLPSSAVVVSAEWLEPLDGGDLAGSEYGRAVFPAGTPATGRVYAAACDVTDSTAPMSSFLVVVAPREVPVVTADGAGLGREQLHEPLGTDRRRPAQHCRPDILPPAGR